MPASSESFFTASITVSSRESGFGGSSVPKVRVSKAKVKGPLSEDIIRRIVRAHINEVRYCYNSALRGNPNNHGKLAVNFVIDASGKVPVATVASRDDTLSESVGTCVAKAIKRWKFPKPTGGDNVVVEYPFIFQAG